MENSTKSKIERALDLLMEAQGELDLSYEKFRIKAIDEAADTLVAAFNLD